MNIKTKHLAKCILSSIIAESNLSSIIRQGVGLQTSSIIHYTPLIEVNRTLGKKIFRMDLLIKISYDTNPTETLFGVEIKSGLKDFRSDRKWFNYLHCCDYFCFAINKNDFKLLQRIESAVDPRVGILTVDFQYTNDLGEHPTSFSRLPLKL